MVRKFLSSGFSIAVLLASGASRAFAQNSVGLDSGKCDPGKLCNPLKGVNSIEGFLGEVIKVILVFAVPVIVLFIMYAGFLFVTANGDEGKVKDAKHALLWAVVGGVIVLGANLIYGVILGTVNGLK